MKTLFSALLFSLFFSIYLSAQLPDGSIAPNITFTDIDGNSHTLYDVLDEGKSVVFDVMATWCGPCWTYHNTHVLRDLYEEYGPDGTDEIEIFMIESSTSTNEACLYGPSGCSGSTFGDWTAGTPYPIVHITSSNGGSFNSDFGIAFFPTLYKICPNRKIYEVGQPPLSTWENWVSSCNLDATAQVNNVVCYGQGDVGIDLTPEGGHGNIAYSWSNGDTTEDLIGAPPGSYSCTITEGQGHSIEVGPFEIDGPSSPLIVNIVNESDVTCAGNNNGSISTSSSGGGTNYSYQWNNGATTPDLMNIPGGVYTLSVTDSYGCTETVTTVIDEPPMLNLSTDAIDENCDQSDGSILLFASGGEGLYFYDIGDGPGTSNVISNLTAGNYIATVTDENGCTETSNITIENAPGPEAEAGTNTTISCTDGTINLDGSSSNSGSDISYTWDTTDGNIVSGASTLSPVVDQPGTYTLIVANTATGCQSSDEVLVEGDLNTPVADASAGFMLTCANASSLLDGSESSEGSQFTYQWLNESNEEISTDVSTDVTQPGIYQLIVTNSDNGCTDYASVEITQDIELPTADAGNTSQITCVVEEVTLDGSNSSQGAEFAYQWINQNGDEISTQMTAPVGQAEVYQLIVTNLENACSSVASVEVSEDTQEPDADAGNDDEITCIANEVSLDGSNSSQGDRFTYQWTNAQDEVISNAIETTSDEAGVYELLVTDTDNGCSNIASVAIIQNTDEPNADAGNTSEINCDNSEVTLDGSSSSQGSGFEYQWIDAQDEVISTDLETSVDQPGTYQLIVTNADNGCSADATVDVSQNIETPNADAGNADEINCTTDEVTLNGSNSSQGDEFEYRWINDQDQVISSNIETSVNQAGTYQLQVTDTNNGCVSDASVVITEDTEIPDANIDNAGDINCINESITLDGSGSSQGSAFEYQWINSEDDVISNELEVTVDEPGDYNLIVINMDNGCTTTESTQVNENTTVPNADAGEDDELNCISTTINLDGRNSSEGSTFEYQWLNSNEDEISTNIEVSIDQADTYELIVTNTDNGCSASALVEITQDIAIPIADAGPDGQLDCDVSSVTLDGNNSSTGSAIEYNWLNSNNTSIGNEISIEVAAAEVYTLIVTDTDNGCSASEQVEVEASTDFPTAIVNVNDIINCTTASVLIDGNGSSQGSNFNYQWLDAEGQELDTDISLSVNTAGSYTFVVTDTDNGCSASSNAIVEENTERPTSEIIEPDFLDCINTSVTLQVDQPAADLSFEWFNLNGMALGNGASIEVANVGTYQLVTTDLSNGCTATSSAQVTASTDLPVADASVSNMLTCINEMATLSAANSSANGTINYEWQNEAGMIFSNNQEVDINTPGTYTLFITDSSNGCSTFTSITVEQNKNAPIATASSSGTLTCVNTSVNLSSTGSTNNNGLNFSWLDVNQMEIGTAPFIETNTAGVYTLVVTDQLNGCSSTTFLEVEEDIEIPVAQAEVNAALNCQLSELNLDGSGSSSGADITYAWTTADGNIVGASNLQNPLINAPGLYELQVLNTNNGCTSKTSVEVNQINTPVLSLVEANNAACFGGANGAATLEVNEGLAPYTFTWSNGATGPSLDNLSAGTYTVIVTDGAGCEDQLEVFIDQPLELSIEIDHVMDNVCQDDTQGAIDISVSGGTSGYSYQWSNGMTIPNLENLPTGNYMVVVSDAAGCQMSTEVAVSAVDHILPTLITEDLTISLDVNGLAMLNADMVDNGTFDNCGIDYKLIQQESFDCSHIGENQVRFEAADLYGNTASKMVTVTVVDEIAPTMSGSGDLISNNCTMVEYTMPIVMDNCNALAPVLIEGLPSGAMFPEGMTIVTYQAEDAAGNIATYSFNITVENTLSNTFDTHSISCFEESDGSISAIPSGGTPSYSYLWNTGATTPTISDVTAGDYSVLITDDTGCQFEEAITLDQPTAIEIVMDNITNEMETGSNGAIEVSVTGGTEGYSFLWTNTNGETVSQEEDLLDAPAGTYTLFVTDMNGCALTSEPFMIDNIVPTINVELAEHISISPNPSIGMIEIKIEFEATRQTQLSILDITGKTIMDWNAERIASRNYPIDLSNLPNGVYLARLIVDGALYVERVVLARP